MKRRIRLTESDLHRIVKESVKRTLNEMEWPTYANAAMKARKRAYDAENEKNVQDYIKYSDMARNFDRGTERALNKQYGGRHGVNTDSEPRQEFRSYDDNPFSIENNTAWRPFEGYEEEWPPYADPKLDKPGSKEIADFVKGKKKYIKGKGWQ